MAVIGYTSSQLEEMLDKPIADLPFTDEKLGTRIVNCLEKREIIRMRDLLSVKWRDLLGTCGFGEEMGRQLLRALESWNIFIDGRKSR